MKLIHTRTAAAVVTVVSAASVTADTDYGQATPASIIQDAVYEVNTEDHFDQYWKNLELCDFNYDLSTCLLKSENELDFLGEEITLKCTVQCVKDFCGGLTLTDKSEIDNGSVHVNEKNCQTTSFANSFLVYQKIITDLNSIIGLTPSLERTTVAKTHLALQITRTNADCVINSFFHFLNQCSAESFISEKDMQCVEEYLTDTKCEFAEEAVDNWNIPALVQRYGIHGYNKVIEQMEESYQVTDETRWLKELKRIVSSGAAQKIHFVDTEYDARTQEAAIQVCPQKFNPINTGGEFIGIDANDVAFHFPSDKIVQVTKKFEGVMESDVEDPDYVEEKCLDTCREWFTYSKKDYEMIQAGGQGENGVKHLRSRCFAVKGYDIFFIESGRIEPLNFKKQENNFVQGNLCYKASWKEPQSCSSHLTEWRMHLACCTSYADYHAEQVPAPESMTADIQHGYTLLAAEKIYAEPVVDIRKVNPADLLFEKTVVSKSGAGSLASLNTRQFSDPEFVINALDGGVASLAKKCETLEDLYSKEYFGHEFKQFCAKVRFHAEAVAGANDNLSDGISGQTDVNGAVSRKLQSPVSYDPPPVSYDTPLYDNESPAEIEFKLGDSYYVGDDAAAVKIGETLHIDLDFSAVVPLVSGKCFPQACVLSQLASCMDEPDAVYTYDPPLPEYKGQSGNTYYADAYVAQPINHGYNGYYN